LILELSTILLLQLHADPFEGQRCLQEKIPKRLNLSSTASFH